MPAPLLPPWIHECVAEAQDEASIEERVARLERLEEERVVEALRVRRHLTIAREIDRMRWVQRVAKLAPQRRRLDN